MKKSLLSMAVSLCLLCFGAVGVHAKSFAILVGVSDYDDSIGLSDLRGPANDVVLLRDVLQTRADFDIRILADGVKGAARPTRKAILDGLDSLVSEAVDGDFVYIHLSGHGTQQADRSGDETDGLDEVFLPADTARAEPGAANIPNAIVDEELGGRIAALRRNGVDVWFVLDSCHSGSGLRAAAPRTRARFVDPKTLGINISASPQPASTTAVEGPGNDALPGRYLAFYAAQSSEVAREILVDEAAQNGWYGLFSSRLAARMQSDSALSYRQLFQAVLTDLGNASVPGGARLQTPLWEGNLVDAPVFGGGDMVGLRQFAVAGNRVQAGLLHGLSDNTVVALVSEAGAPADAVLSFAQLQQTDARTAALVSVKGDCVAQVETPCPPTGPVPQAAKFARLVAKPHDAILRIAPPIILASGAPAPADHALSVALSRAIEASNSEFGTNIQLDPEAIVLSGIQNGELWFGQKLSAGNTPVGLHWGPERGNLKSLLVRIAKAEDLARTFASVAGNPSLLFPNPVKIQIQRMVSDATRLNASTPQDLRAECMSALRSASVSAELPQGQSVKQCDQVAFGAQGLVQGPARDVNRVYIDSQYCVYSDYQRVEGVSQPAILGQPITICSDCPNDAGTVESKAGVERMFVVVTEALDNQEALNLEGLLENCDAAGGATRSGNVAQAEGLLQSIARRDATRGGMSGFGISDIWVEEFMWQVLPRREALSQAGLALENTGDNK